MHSSGQHELSDPRVALLKELAEPLRLRVVDTLGHRGPSSVSELAAHLEVPLPQLSNHLRRLREAGLVRVERTGRHAIYELADPGLESLLPLLDSITGRVAPARPPGAEDFSRARTCYDHLAGWVGVALYAALRDRDALRGHSDGSVELGPNAAATLRSLGVDAQSVQPGRRRFAFECLDVTQHEPHLAGALGDAITESLTEKGWIEPAGEGRVMRVTQRGKSGLKRALGISFSA
jgi:DNA-binding transcriptional ArsR family regulator